VTVLEGMVEGDFSLLQPDDFFEEVEVEKKTPEFAICRPISRWRAAIWAMLSSSTRRRSAADIWPAACAWRASRSACGRNKLPT